MPESLTRNTSTKPGAVHNDTIRLVVAAEVFAGIERGLLDRSVIGSPATYRDAQRFTVGQDTWNRAATSLIGTPWSTTSRATLSR